MRDIPIDTHDASHAMPIPCHARSQLRARTRTIGPEGLVALITGACDGGQSSASAFSSGAAAARLLAALDANSASTNCTASSLQGQTSRDVIEYQRHCCFPCEAPLNHAAPRCCDQPNAVTGRRQCRGLRCRSGMVADRLCQLSWHTRVAQHLSRRALPSGSACYRQLRYSAYYRQLRYSACYRLLRRLARAIRFGVGRLCVRSVRLGDSGLRSKSGNSRSS